MKTIFFGDYNEYVNITKNLDPMFTFYCSDKKEADSCRSENIIKGIPCRVINVREFDYARLRFNKGEISFEELVEFYNIRY